jgi:hypothetical protein
MSSRRLFRLSIPTMLFVLPRNAAEREKHSVAVSYLTQRFYRGTRMFAPAFSKNAATLLRNGPE